MDRLGLIYQPIVLKICRCVLNIIIPPALTSIGYWLIGLKHRNSYRVCRHRPNATCPMVQVREEDGAHKINSNVTDTISFCYLRYLNHRRPKGGFYDPPPMISRYGRKSASGGGGVHSIYSTLQRPSEYSGGTATTWSVRHHESAASPMEAPLPPPTAPSAMSHHTEASYTATSTML